MIENDPGGPQLVLFSLNAQCGKHRVTDGSRPVVDLGSDHEGIVLPVDVWPVDGADADHQRVGYVGDVLRCCTQKITKKITLVVSTYAPGAIKTFSPRSPL